MNTRKYKRVLLTALGLAAFWWLGQLSYRGWVAYRWHQQEAQFPRDAHGIREGCASFELPGQAPALLFVHGFADSPLLFKEMAEDLSSEGYACHAIRLPGFADSMDQMQTATRTDWLLSLQEELDQLNQEYGSCVIIAHSLGGALALKAFQQNPQNIDGLVLMAPLLAPSRKRSPVFTPRTWFQLRHVLCPGVDCFANVFDMDASSNRTGTYPRDSIITANVYAELFSLLDDLHEHPVSINTPILLLQGAHDRVVDNTAARKYLKASGTQVTPYMLPHSGHVIPLGEDRDQAMKLITEFLAAPPEKDATSSTLL